MVIQPQKKKMKKKSLIKPKKVKLGSKNNKMEPKKKEKAENIKVGVNKSGKRKGMEDGKENPRMKKIKTEQLRKDNVGNVSAVNNTGGKTQRKNKKGKINGHVSPTVEIAQKINLKVPKNKSFEENEHMTLYENVWVKKEAVSQLNDLRKNLTEQGLSGEEVEKKMKTAKQNFLFELIRDHLSEKKKQMQEGKGKQKERIPLEFQEDDLMTDYDGYWVLRKRVEHLNKVKEQKLQAILSSPNGSIERELTIEENTGFQRAMKREKRFEHKKLVRELRKIAVRKRQQKKKSGIVKKKVGITKKKGGITKEKGEITKKNGGISKGKGGITKKNGGITKGKGGITKKKVGTKKGGIIKKKVGTKKGEITKRKVGTKKGGITKKKVGTKKGGLNKKKVGINKKKVGIANKKGGIAKLRAKKGKSGNIKKSKSKK